MLNSATILTVPQICETLTISEATLRRYVKAIPDFPKRIHLGPRRVGFLKSEVERFIADRHDAAKRFIG